MDEANGDGARAPEPGDFLTVEETARLLRLTVGGVLRLKARENLPAYRVGSRLLFNRHELGLWLAARRTERATQ
jgi:excisionase family DNA binding protein